MKLTTRIPANMPYGYFELESESVEELLEQLSKLANVGSLAAKNFLANEFNVK